MELAWRTLAATLMLCLFAVSVAQDYDGEAVALPPAAETCNGIFLTYDFISRIKEYPRLKNATAQAWAFKSTATILNAGATELAAWKMFIGFNHKEILVGASGAVMMDGGDFPADVSNGTYLSGSPMANLKTSIETAGDLDQIQAKIELTGTQFGVKPPGIPMPKTIKLENDGFKCPAPTRKKTSMYVCCVKDKKFKPQIKKTKFLPRQKGDLLMSYDILQAYTSSYLAQVTIENSNPIGRLDHWNLTWEWMRGEFIYSMKGAYTRLIDATDCLYGEAGKYYGDLDFSKVMNCQKKPIISDLPRERYNDTQVGKIPYCCRNGTILPRLMDPSESKSVFQVQVFKLPPEMNRTGISPPEKWKITGDLNPDYKCGPPMRVAPTQIPDPSGLQTATVVVATWQVVCNITKPTKKDTKCCVSFSAYYSDSVIPCNTCACGCEEETKKCNANAPAMLLPPEALLVPFSNRSLKAIDWAKIQHLRVPKPLPCPDNCGVSMNWHVSGDYKMAWTARITLFNWEEANFENWFTAIQLKKAGRGYEKAYSFNGTFLRNHQNTIFIQGLKGLNYLMGETNGSSKGDPRVPGKQQSVISFTKKLTPGVKIAKGDGFPSKVFFNGEECSLPKRFPKPSGSTRNANTFLQYVVLPIVTYFVIENCC